MLSLLAIISFLCIVFVLFLLSYIKNRDKNQRLEEENKKERLVTETITQVQENERSRIRCDLHDTVTQDIRTALLYIHRLSDSASLSQEQKSLLEKIQKISEESLKNIRNIIRNLTLGEIETASITRLLFELCENVNQNGGIKCKFYDNESDLFSKITTEQKLHIFRIVQESITNAQKHSMASEISVIVREEKDSGDKKAQGILCMICDDGVGFSEAQEAKNTSDLISQNTHLGIKGMKSRATLLGANLEIKSSCETGTQVKLFVKVE